jgi:hypothetical protein
MPRFLIAAALLALPTGLFACLWDYDTLKQERARFPDTLEIITGKFLRHSPEFYEWRIKDRLAKLKTDPSNPALHDDLAVAYAKTGQYAKAIATMEALEKIAPGRYETYSNLGTFHFLAGDIPKALPLIDKALAINPDAHFGREKYQRWLGEYLLSKRSRVLPIAPPDMNFLVQSDRGSFAAFLRQKLNNDRLEVTDLQPAIRGVLGMMRFADHENPVLLEVLGDLLAHDWYVPAGAPGEVATVPSSRVRSVWAANDPSGCTTAFTVSPGVPAPSGTKIRPPTVTGFPSRVTVPVSGYRFGVAGPDEQPDAETTSATRTIRAAGIGDPSGAAPDTIGR